MVDSTEYVASFVTVISREVPTVPSSHFALPNPVVSVAVSVTLSP